MNTNGMKTYGQYCPIARAAEILGQRWTFLILRDLLFGGRRFNEIQRGVPRMSPTLLTRRLKELEANGLITRVRDEETGVAEYHPTQAAYEVEPIIRLMGAWGQRWVRNRLGEDKLDVSMLMWYLHRGLDPDVFPRARTTISFEFTDRPRLKKDDWWLDHWWLVVEAGAVDLCVKDPGHEVDLYVVSDLRTMTRITLGDITVRHAQKVGALELHGRKELARRFADWLPMSSTAGVARPPEPLDLDQVLADCACGTPDWAAPKTRSRV